MRIVVITPPAPIVTWEEADAHLRLGGDEGEQSYVENLIEGVSGLIDGPEGYLKRAIGVQTLEARFSLLAVGNSVPLIVPPVIDLVSVKYLDVAGAEHIADLSGVAVDGDELVTVDSDWPWIGGSLRREAGFVRYRAGYEAIPAQIRTAALLMIGELYEKRELAASGIGGAAADLLQPYRVYR